MSVCMVLVKILFDMFKINVGKVGNALAWKVKVDGTIPDGIYMYTCISDQSNLLRTDQMTLTMKIGCFLKKCLLIKIPPFLKPNLT